MIDHMIIEKLKMIKEKSIKKEILMIILEIIQSLRKTEEKMIMKERRGEMREELIIEEEMIE